MNTLLLLAAVATIVFMFLQDIFGSSLVVAEARELKFWPGLFDGLGDLVSRYGVVIAAVAAVHFGLWSWQTAVLAGLTAITSFFTSNLAVGKASMLLPKSRLEQLGRKAKKAELALAADLKPPTTITKQGEQPPMSLLDTIAAKFHAVPKLIAGEVADAEKLAHSSIAEKAEAFVKDVLPLIPEGGPAEEFVKRVQEGVSWAHQALAEGEGELAKVEAAPAAPAPAAAPVEAQPEPVTEPAPAEPVAAPVADPVLAAAAVDPQPVEAVPAAAAPVNPGDLFTTTLTLDQVDAAAWPVSSFKTADGQVLYTWAGQGPAPAGAEPTWVAYTGPVVAA